MRLPWLVLLTACADHPAPVFVAIAPPQTTTPARFEHKPHVPETCEDAMDEKRELVASGKGPNHPDMLAVDGVLAECNSASPPARLLRTRPRPPVPTCGEAKLEQAASIALGKGPKHPRMIYLDVVLAACPSVKPTADECLVVARERAELESRGYGPQHPSMIASDAKLALCP